MRQAQEAAIHGNLPAFLNHCLTPKTRSHQGWQLTFLPETLALRVMHAPFGQPGKAAFPEDLLVGAQPKQISQKPSNPLSFSLSFGVLISEDIIAIRKKKKRSFYSLEKFSFASGYRAWSASQSSRPVLNDQAPTATLEHSSSPPGTCPQFRV